MSSDITKLNLSAVTGGFSGRDDTDYVTTMLSLDYYKFQ